MRAERAAQRVVHPGMGGGGGGEQARDVLLEMAPVAEQVGQQDDVGGAARDQGGEARGDVRAGELHVGAADHVLRAQPRDARGHVVKLGVGVTAAAAVVDQEQTEHIGDARGARTRANRRVRARISGSARRAEADNRGMTAYLDYNATAPLLPAARAAWLEAQELAWGNPASTHTYGQQARHHLDQAKARIAGLLGCRAGELVLTSGGTEANALAIASALHGAPASAPAAILASAIEHSSVLRNAERAGALALVPVDDCGRVRAERLAELLMPTTRLVCLQFANNELGTLQEVAELRALVRARAPAARLLLDCCQGAGKRALALTGLEVDFATIAGHKFGTPKGVGLLYARSGVAVVPQLQGGRQQQDRRSGSEDVAATAALAAALAHALAQAPAEDARQRALLTACWAHISAALPAARWLAQGAERLANTMSLAHPGAAREVLVTRLDLAGFAVSAGAACMARRAEPSHVIAALGLERALAESAIRVSIGPGTTCDELDGFARAYVREVRALTAPA